MHTGADIVAAAEKKLGQQYVFGANVPLNDPGWSGPWDCAEYCSWAVYQAIKLVFGCTNNGADPEKADAYTGAWKRDAIKFSCAISVDEASLTKGAMLLRRSSSSGHIAISDGTGNGTLEARGKAYGVGRFTVRDRLWTTGIKVPDVIYETAPAPEGFVSYTPPFTYRTLEEGIQTGGEIGKLQEILKSMGYYDGTPNGRFDLQTEIAVREFQLKSGLVPDGIVDAETGDRIGISVSENRVAIEK